MRKKKDLKKHQKENILNIINEFSNEFSNIEDIRFYSIICHQYIDYFLNEILIERFPNLKFIIDDYDLGSFRNKFKILKSDGMFENFQYLEKNIEMITKIRNFYAHNMMKKGDIPNKVKIYVNNMTYPDVLIDQMDNKKELIESMKLIKENLTDAEIKFRIVTFYTIFQLILVSKKLTNELIISILTPIMISIFQGVENYIQSQYDNNGL